jgi:hypothetical protein
MATTQVRISTSSHALLHDLAAQSGETMQEIVEKALEQYRRSLFLEGLSEDFRKFRASPTEADNEIELWETTIADGVDVS